MKNSCKLRIVENFVSIDYICFGDLLKNLHTGSNRDIREYMELKGSLCSILSEFYNLVDFDPGMPENKIDANALYENAKANSIIARGNSKTIMESENGKKQLQLQVGKNIEEFSESDTKDIVDFTIHEKAMQIALDNLLIARMLNENEIVPKMQTFEGVILEDAYKTLRDSIVEKAIEIINT